MKETRRENWNLWALGWQRHSGYYCQENCTTKKNRMKKKLQKKRKKENDILQAWDGWEVGWSEWRKSFDAWTWCSRQLPASWPPNQIQWKLQEKSKTSLWGAAKKQNREWILVFIFGPSFIFRYFWGYCSWQSWKICISNILFWNAPADKYIGRYKVCPATDKMGANNIWQLWSGRKAELILTTKVATNLSVSSGRNILSQRGRNMRQNLAELDLGAQLRLKYEAGLRLQHERKWK